jgi:ADP-heptose:LPS heptosyltransferase
MGKKNAENKKYTNIPLATDISQILDKKILIWQEQGLGDTIQFSRFVIDINKYSKNTTLVVHKKLKDLLSYISPLVRVIEYDLLDLEKEKFDFQLPICSLPKFLKIKKIEDISYYKLQLPKKNIRNLDHNILNIGLAWSGNPNYLHDEYRSIPFNYFKKILNFNKTNFYKLSKNLRIQELLDYSSYNMIDLGDKDFSDLSHLVKDLDLVISSDTSIIHLSGILGINSILLLNFNSDWRWFDSYKITPWYPSVRIIKQKKLNDWEYVFDQLNDEIKVIHKTKFN